MFRFAMSVVCILILSLLSPFFASARSTAFKEQIDQCGLSFKSSAEKLKQMSKVSELKELLDSDFLLLSEKIIEQEVIYMQDKTKFKLKIVNNQITLLRFDENDFAHEVIDDAGRKVTTAKGRAKQILLNKKIIEDWGQFQEIRENGLEIDYSVRDLQISKLAIKILKLKKQLVCKSQPESDVCQCLNLKS